MTPAPAWVRRARLNQPRRGVRLTTCPRCSALILCGLDADVAAVTVRVDYLRLSTLGEVLALAEGRRTFVVSRRGRGYQLDPRRAGHVRIDPANTTGVVVAEHVCGTTWPSGAVHLQRRPIQPPPRGTLRDEPEF